MSGHTPQCAAWRAFMFAWRVLTSSLLSQRQPGALACQLEPHGFQNRLQNRTSSTLPLMSCRLRTPAKKTILLRLKHDVQYQQHGMVCHLIRSGTLWLNPIQCVLWYQEYGTRVRTSVLQIFLRQLTWTSETAMWRVSSHHQSSSLGSSTRPTSSAFASPRAPSILPWPLCQSKPLLEVATPA